MIITKEFLDRCRTKKGAFTKKQAELLGLDWPLRKDWIRAMIGEEIEDDVAQEFSKSNKPVAMNIKKKRKAKKPEPKKNTTFVEFEIKHIKNNYNKITEPQYEYICILLDKMPYNFNRELLMDISKKNAGSLIGLLKSKIAVVFIHNNKVINDVDALLDYAKDSELEQDSLMVKWILLLSKFVQIQGEKGVLEWIEVSDKKMDDKIKGLNNS